MGNFDWSAYHTYRVVKEGAKITAYIDNYVFDLGNSMQTTVSTCPEKMKFGMWPARPGNGLDGATVKNVQFMYSAEYHSPLVVPTGLIGITTVSSGEYLFGSNSLLKYDNIEFGGLSDMTVIWDMKTSNGFNTPQHGQQLNIFWYGDYVSCGWGFIIRRHDNANMQDMYTVGGAGNAYASTRAFYDTVLPSNFDWSAYHTYRVVKEGAKITAYIDNYVFDLGNSMQTTVSTCPEKMKFGMWPARPGNGLDGATVKNVQFMYSAEYP